MANAGPACYNVLFLCTANSARSIMAEAILNHVGKGLFRAYSAGSHPSGVVNPVAIETLESMKVSTRGLRSKSWSEFERPDGPVFDFIVTVCDKAAGEACPLWPGTAMKIHWGVPDPVPAGNPEKNRNAFHETYRFLNRRISLFVSLPVHQLDRISLGKRLSEIGRIGP